MSRRSFWTPPPPKSPQGALPPDIGWGPSGEWKSPRVGSLLRSFDRDDLSSVRCECGPPFERGWVGLCRCRCRWSSSDSGTRSLRVVRPSSAKASGRWSGPLRLCLDTLRRVSLPDPRRAPMRSCGQDLSERRTPTRVKSGPDPPGSRGSETSRSQRQKRGPHDLDSLYHPTLK